MTAILIVEGHEIMRRGLRQVLVEGLGEIRVSEASSAEEALAAIAEQAWHLVILDVHMPGRGGIEMLGELRREHPDLPILAISTSPEESLAVRCIRLGAAGYVTKASAAAIELLTAVRKVLAGGRYISASLAEKLAEMLGGGLQEPHETLSARELQVVRMVAWGRTSKQIALELRLSEKTVATYRRRIAEKMGISTGIELARYAIRHRLVD